MMPRQAAHAQPQSGVPDVARPGQQGRTTAIRVGRAEGGIPEKEGGRAGELQGSGESSVAAAADATADTVALTRRVSPSGQ
jgi:hypothetical protein